MGDKIIVVSFSVVCDSDFINVNSGNNISYLQTLSHLDGGAYEPVVLQEDRLKSELDGPM